MRPFIFVLLLLVLQHYPVLLSAQQSYLRHFSVDEGLPSNEVYQVMEDEHGYLLIATDRGAVRFNGYDFEQVPVASGNPASTPSYYLYRSPQGRIFSSSSKGMIYSYDQAQLHGYPYNFRTTALYTHPSVLIANTISQYHDSLWISFNNDYNFNLRIGSCVVAPDGSVSKLEQPDGLYFDLRKKFYYRELNDSLHTGRIQPVTIQWEDGTRTRDSIDLSWPGAYIRRLFYTRVNDLDVFAIGRVLLVYRNHKRLYSHRFERGILCVETLPDHHLYIGLENGGCTAFGIDGAQLGPPVRHYLSELSVTSIYTDRQGGTWLSTMEDGLYYQHPSGATIWPLNDKVQAIEKAGGEVQAADRSGVVRVFRNGQPLRAYAVPLPPGSFLSGLSLSYGSTVVLTSRGFCWQEHGRWRSVRHYESLLLPAANDTMYAADSRYPVLHVYKGLSAEIIKDVQLPKRIVSMCYGNGRLWLGTLEGLFLYEQGVLKNPGNTAVFRDRIIGIHPYAKDVLLVASLNSGLALLRTNGEIHVLDTKNGLTTPTINSVDVDGNTIWLGTNRGLARVLFDGKGFSTSYYGLEDGLPTLDIHQFKVADNRVYLKWINRLVCIPVNKLLQPRAQPHAFITSILLEKTQQQWSPGIRITHSDNDWQFNFVSPDLASAGKQVYDYRLQGLDHSWHTTRQRYAQYTNLPPGSYTFEVRPGAGATGSTQFAFTIPPAFWQTTWFSILLTIAALGMLALVFWLRIRAINRKNQLLLDLAESRQKMLVQLIKPHFIFNVLNTVQSAILKQDRIAATGIISRFAKLLRMSLETTRENFTPMENEIELLKNYFELESTRVPGKFSYVIETKNIDDRLRLEIPSMLLQPFAENAVLHGVNNLVDKKGAIHILFHMESGRLTCRIEDNGIGRVQSRRDHGASAHKSLGIDLTVNRLKLLHYRHRSTFFFEIKDGAAGMSNTTGTSVTFSIPYKLAE